MRQRTRRETRGVNYNNLIRIRYANNYKEKTQNQNKAILPKICCFNARSINEKVDELAAFMSVNKVHIAAITESWLTDEDIDWRVCNSTEGPDAWSWGWGVCVYVSLQIPITRCLELEDLYLECMWLWARPPRLPRPLSAIHRNNRHRMRAPIFSQSNKMSPKNGAFKRAFLLGSDSCGKEFGAVAEIVFFKHSIFKKFNNETKLKNTFSKENIFVKNSS